MRFIARLIRFRKAHASLRRRTFFEDEADRRSSGTARSSASPTGKGPRVSLGMQLTGADGDEPIYVFANAHWLPATFELPRLRAWKQWRRFLDTSLAGGKDALEPGSEAALGGARTYVAGRAPRGPGGEVSSGPASRLGRCRSSASLLALLLAACGGSPRPDALARRGVPRRSRGGLTRCCTPRGTRVVNEAGETVCCAESISAAGW